VVLELAGDKLFRARGPLALSPRLYLLSDVSIAKTLPSFLIDENKVREPRSLASDHAACMCKSSTRCDMDNPPI
jgi:hypothetical protein